jgi:hypothetical protein
MTWQERSNAAPHIQVIKTVWSDALSRPHFPLRFDRARHPPAG